ncbi:hypothetical protein LZ32DRAFT_665522 [Colletotrichum eremochloae]|nr:hypothetical protein LZ32DRAFT_665522 [Colletotrichum eremochloae]
MVIWRQFVEGTKWAPSKRLTDEQYQKLATLSINGREIKNIVKTAFGITSEITAGPRASEEGGGCKDGRELHIKGFCNIDDDETEEELPTGPWLAWSTQQMEDHLVLLRRVTAAQELQVIILILQVLSRISTEVIN